MSKTKPVVASIADLDVRPIGGRLGAEVHGVRLSGDLSAATVDAIRQTLLRHKVIFFRGQTHLDEVSHEAFGRLFGDLAPHPTVPSLNGTTSTLDIDGSRGASSWHTDVTFVDAYPNRWPPQRDDAEAVGGCLIVRRGWSAQNALLLPQYATHSPVQ